MKRTPKNGGEKRDAVFRFSVNAAEKKIIEDNAAREGLTISDYIRKQADEYKKSVDRNTLIRLSAELGKQGGILIRSLKPSTSKQKQAKPPATDEKKAFLNKLQETREKTQGRSQEYQPQQFCVSISCKIPLYGGKMP